MVLNVTCIFELAVISAFGRWQSALELSHDHLERFPHHVGQNIESTSVGHTNNKVSCSIINSGIDADLHSGNKTIATLEAESFHGVELLRKEKAEIVRPVQSIVEGQFLNVSHAFVLNTFEVESNPVLNRAIRNVREFDTHLAAVGSAVSFDNVSELPDLLLLENGGFVGQLNVEFTVQVLLSETVVFVVKTVL